TQLMIHRLFRSNSRDLSSLRYLQMSWIGPFSAGEDLGSLGQLSPEDFKQRVVRCRAIESLKERYIALSHMRDQINEGSCDFENYAEIFWKHALNDVSIKKYGNRRPEDTDAWQTRQRKKESAQTTERRREGLLTQIKQLSFYAMQGMNSARLRVTDVEEYKQCLQRATFDRMTNRVVGSKTRRSVPNSPSIQELNAHGLGLSDSGLIVELSVPPRGTGIVTDKDPISALLKSPPKPTKRKHDPPKDSRKRPKPDSPRPDPTPVNDAINQNFEQQNHGQVPEPRPELTLADDGNTEHEDGLENDHGMADSPNGVQPEMATICVADCTFVIEKDLLCSYSDVFESMFTGELLEKKTQEVRLPDEDFTPVKAFVYWILNESKFEKKGITDLGLSESEKIDIAEIIKPWKFGDERQCAAGFENAVLQALIDRAKRHPDRI
ncbi:MAG: hypothetical protein Q9228_006249, partial [Teloschistes exilis]